MGVKKYTRKRFTPKKKVPPPYRSWLEYELHKGPFRHFDYEPTTVTYDVVITGKKYTPDFILEDGTCIEIKGFFRDIEEAKKYIFIASSGHDIIFVFQNPNVPVPWAKKRKDGTKMTHAEWAERNGFEWYSVTSLPYLWTTPM